MRKRRIFWIFGLLTEHHGQREHHGHWFLYSFGNYFQNKRFIYLIFFCFSFARFDSLFYFSFCAIFIFGQLLCVICAASVTWTNDENQMWLISNKNKLHHVYTCDVYIYIYAIAAAIGVVRKRGKNNLLTRASGPHADSSSLSLSPWVLFKQKNLAENCCWFAAHSSLCFF